MKMLRVFRKNVGRRWVLCLLVACLVNGAIGPRIAGAQTKKAGAPARRPLTQADVEKRWKAADDTLLVNEIRLRGLGFTPSGYWLDVELPAVTGVSAPQVPGGAAALRHLIPTPPDLDEVASQAPALLESLKAAAQKRSDSDMLPLVDASLLANKASIYDVFDTSSFRAASLGKPVQDDHGDVGLPYFKLETSNVEKLYYVLFSKPKGKLIVEDFITGTGVADLYLHDQKVLANRKLETMFRSLNDGDQAGVKELCTPGLYEAIQAWGGDKHPGDKVTRGRSLSQVTVQTSVPLDQKSVRVVTKISYPLTGGKVLAFFVDFERIGNDLKVVRLRDLQNKVIVFDPNIDNYLNRRYNLPDSDPLTDVVMTDDPTWLSYEQIKSAALRALLRHDLTTSLQDATNLVESAPTNGTGYGIRAAVDLMKRDNEAATRDGLRALELNGTAYYVVERHGLTSSKPFTLVLLGISKSKIDYLPSPGAGGPEVIDLASTQVAFEKPIPFVRRARPFLKWDFKGPDGKKKGPYNFADFGTVCPADNSPRLATDLINEEGGGACGVDSTSGTIQGAKTIPVLTSPAWHEDLSTVITVVNTAKNGAHK